MLLRRGHNERQAQQATNPELARQLYMLLAQDILPLVPEDENPYHYFTRLGFNLHQIAILASNESNGNLELSPEDRCYLKATAAAAYFKLIQLAKGNLEYLIYKHQDLAPSSDPEVEQKAIKRSPGDVLKLFRAARKLDVPYDTIIKQIKTNESMKVFLSEDTHFLHKLSRLDIIGVTDEEQKAVNKAFDIIHAIVEEALANLRIFNKLGLRDF